MRLYISKEIEEKANIKAVRKQAEGLSDEWKCDLITLNRRKIIVFLNEKTGLVLFSYRPKEGDFKHLSDILNARLSEFFQALSLPYSDSNVEIYKGESKKEMERIKGRLSLFQNYISDSDESLIYLSYILNSRKRQGVSPLSEYVGVIPDKTIMVRIKEAEGEKRRASILIPALFTLSSLEKAIDILFDNKGDEKRDFTKYSEETKSLDYIFRRPLFRALSEDLDPALKKKGCSYALTNATLLSTVNGEITYRYSFDCSKHYDLSFEEGMDGLNLKSPMALLVKWKDTDDVNVALKEITS